MRFASQHRSHLGWSGRTLQGSAGARRELSYVGIPCPSALTQAVLAGHAVHTPCFISRPARTGRVRTLLAAQHTLPGAASELCCKAPDAFTAHEQACATKSPTSPAQPLPAPTGSAGTTGPPKPQTAFLGYFFPFPFHWFCMRSDQNRAERGKTANCEGGNEGERCTHGADQHL